MKYSIVIFIFALLSGCSTLDTNSQFTEVVDQVKRFHYYTEVTSKPYRPEVVAIKGLTPTKSQLHIIAKLPTPNLNQEVPVSKIKLKITYLKNYSEYKLATINGVKKKIINDLPLFESCSDLCMNIQFMDIGLSYEELLLGSKSGLRLVLSSENETIVTEVHIPSQYLENIITQSISPDELRSAISKENDSDEQFRSEIDLQPSNSEAMVKYWFNQASETEKKAFLDEALLHREEQLIEKQNSNRTVDMMIYWFNQVDINDRKNLLSWLIVQ